jgi:hypothetical protein
MRRNRLSIALVLVLGSTAQAATITVNSTADPGADDGQCTLHEAVVALNKATVGTSGCAASGVFGTDDTILFDPALDGGTIPISGQINIKQPLTITGPTGGVTIQSDGSERIFNFIPGNATLALNNLTLTGGNAGTPSSGGGVFAFGNVTLMNSTVSGNSSGNFGGGVNAFGNVMLTNSTVSGNSAGKDGGGVNAFGNVTLMNSTVSGNTAGRDGGGVNAFLVTSTNSTVSGNMAGENGGGMDAFSNVTLNNTILSANTAPRSPNLFSGGTISANFSLLGSDISPNSGGNNIEKQDDPQLDSLADNGGPTQTRALLLGSLALDVIPGGNGSCNDTGITTDQRGEARPQPADGNCDIGAFELVDDPPMVFVQNLTAQLDASGNATITAANVDGGSNDDFGIASFSINQSSFTCANVGANTVTLTATDTSGQTATADATVTVEDISAPNALAQNITVQLDGNGAASITAADIDGGSNDVCGIDGLALDRNTFTSADLGAHTVTLTVTDVNGNMATVTATVTVEDNVAPEAICQDHTVILDENGIGSITTAVIDNGSSDNVAIDSVSVSPNEFTGADLGPNTVTLTVTDISGNTASCTATVTVSELPK